MYKERLFNINLYHGENEFNINALLDHIRGAILNICAKGQKNHIIDKSIQTTKKGEHYITHSLSYKMYTILMTISLMVIIIQPGNYFTRKCIIIKRLGANKIIIGNPNTNFNIKICFGSYVTVYTGTKK